MSGTSMRILPGALERKPGEPYLTKEEKIRKIMEALMKMGPSPTDHNINPNYDPILGRWKDTGAGRFNRERPNLFGDHNSKSNYPSGKGMPWGRPTLSSANQNKQKESDKLLGRTGLGDRKKDAPPPPPVASKPSDERKEPPPPPPPRPPPPPPPPPKG